MKLPRISFTDFIEKFPKLEPPIDILENTHLDFSRENPPLPLQFIEEYLIPIEPYLDELSEIVPCFRIEEPNQFYGLVYWRAQLLNYDYFLITYSWKQEFIDRVRIAGTRYKEDKALISLAKINEDWIIDMLEGIGNIPDPENFKVYDTTQSRSHYIEILDNGKILSPHETH